jgi:hypothetical protein
MSRMILVAVVGFWAIIAPNTPAIKPTYELEPAKHVIPTGLVSGVMAGEQVVAEVHLEGQKLVLQKLPEFPGDPWHVWIDLPPEAVSSGTYRLVVKPDESLSLPILVEFPKPVMLKQWEVFGFVGWNPTQLLGWRGGCSLTLELGKREKGRLTGKIYLSLGELDTQTDSQRRTFLAGTFEAACPRQPTDQPGVEDVPLINGAVTVLGAPADATLRVGYVATPTPSTFPLGGTEIQLGEPIEPPRWAQADHDHPRITNLIAGNGKDVPSRYEHSKLTPNRYLVFASLKDGPAAWKWVNVLPTSTIAADLTIDAAHTGGVEVTVPSEVLGGSKVHLVPAEEPGQPAPGPQLFMAIALHMRLEREVKARKVLYTNLAPGRYEIRAGGQSRFVDIIAGKTLELDFEKGPPLPTVPVVPAPETKPMP